MRKRWLLALLLAFPCSAAAQGKQKPLPMPPLVSHDQPISNYACVFSQQPDASASEYSYWNVLAFAEYGKEHKRYWSKNIGTFHGTSSVTSRNSESAGSGAAIGAVNENFHLPDAQKRCSDWRGAVHEMILKAEKK